MMTKVQNVLSGNAPWHVEQADALDFLRSLPADSCQLVFGSPPYATARTYGIGFKLAGEEWASWMTEIIQAALRCCTGLVAFVVEGQTKKFRWSAEPALLMANLHRAGVCLRRPCIFHRVGIPGSGGPDWLRADTEFIVCATRPGKLPWSDNTACGHTPKWAPGGAMSHRLSNGSRVNQWGHPFDTGIVDGGRGNRINTKKGQRPSHRLATPRRVVRGSADGDTITSDSYLPPTIANPGNVIHCKVGGGLLGSPLAHENEAPFPLQLATFFVRSFCPPGGLVVDCFSGSGTTGHAALQHGRRYLGCDVRQSQVELTARRLRGVTPEIFEKPAREAIG